LEEEEVEDVKRFLSVIVEDVAKGIGRVRVTWFDENEKECVVVFKDVDEFIALVESWDVVSEMESESMQF
jgi:hypothetical protein